MPCVMCATHLASEGMSVPAQVTVWTVLQIGFGVAQLQYGGLPYVLVPRALVDEASWILLPILSLVLPVAVHIPICNHNPDMMCNS